MPLMQSGTYANPRLDLGQALWEYMLGSQPFVGTKILPIFKTPRKAAAFSKITRESILRGRNTERNARGAYSRDDYGLKDGTYSCVEHGFEQPLDDSERTLYQNDFAAESAAAQIAMNIVLQEQEKRIATKVFNTTTWTGSSLFTDRSSTPWATAGTDIIGHVEAAKTKVRNNSGADANALIISDTLLRTGLKTNTAIRDAIKYVAIPTENAIIDALQGLFGLPNIIVAKAVKNTALEGGSYSGADTWSASYAMVARICVTDNDLTEPGLGRTFLWSADTADNATVEEYREEQTRSWIYRSRQFTDENIFDANFGHLMQVA